ncbi:MAG: DUF4124 domain-containing protein [Pseudomonadota bacterium]
MPLRLLLTLAALLAAPVAGAGVFKCAQADGRVVFSDHPCTNDQTGGAMKGVATAGPATTGGNANGNAPTTSIDTVRQKAARERVHQGLTPECRILGDKASRVLQSDSNASMDEVKRAVGEFEGKCADQVVEASRKESARGGSGSNKNAPLDAASCQKLRQSLDADRARLGRMTDKEKFAFVTQQNEVSMACR